MSLSIIIPTIGRPSLKKTIESILPQWEPGDQIIVVGDGEQPNAEDIVSHYYSEYPVEYHETSPTRCFGHAQRNFGMEVAMCSHLSFMDDDDWYAQNALPQIRSVIKMTPDKPLIFQMQYPNRFVLWQHPHLVEANVGTPMIVVPNVPEKLGVWGNRREGDWDFLHTMKWAENEISWWPVVIAQIGFNDGEAKR